MTRMILAMNNTELLSKVAGDHSIMHVSILPIVRT